MAGKKPHKVAEIEAFQEAGVKGVIRKRPVGVYPYAKIMPDGESRLCFVTVFPLRVTLEKVTWRETAERHRQWFSQDEAADLVDEGALALIIAQSRAANGPKQSTRRAAGIRCFWHC